MVTMTLSSSKLPEEEKPHLLSGWQLKHISRELYILCFLNIEVFKKHTFLPYETSVTTIAETSRCRNGIDEMSYTLSDFWTVCEQCWVNSISFQNNCSLIPFFITLVDSSYFSWVCPVYRNDHMLIYVYKLHYIPSEVLAYACTYNDLRWYVIHEWKPVEQGSMCFSAFRETFRISFSICTEILPMQNLERRVSQAILIVYETSNFAAFVKKPFWPFQRETSPGILRKENM